TNLNPKFIEAIDLKQKVSGKEVTSVDNSSIRSFVRDMILADREPGAAVPTPTKTGDDKSPAKPSNPTASTDPFADADDLDLPFDYENQPSQPEADQVLKDSSTQTQAAKPATQPSGVASAKPAAQ